MEGGVKNYQKLRDVIYGRRLTQTYFKHSNFKYTFRKNEAKHEFIET
jgi:hypothetical protein